VKQEMMMGSDEVRSLKDLYERYSGPIFGYLIHLSGDYSLADELTGETFYRAMLALDNFRGEADVSTWLLRIARNLYFKKVKKERRVASLEALQERGMAFVSKKPNPEKILVQQERSQSIQQALLSLSESDRSILLLANEARMRCREIAKVLDISVSAVKVRLYRARRRLAVALNVEEGWNP
jgi:RNA polymerase sigma-70 factor (ECF subfamily)